MDENLKRKVLVDTAATVGLTWMSYSAFGFGAETPLWGTDRFWRPLMLGSFYFTCTLSKKKCTLLCGFQGHQPITEPGLHLDHALEHVFSHVCVQLKLPVVVFSQAKPEMTKRVSHFAGLLPRRGPKAFEVFIKTCVMTGQVRNGMQRVEESGGATINQRGAMSR